MRSSPRTGKMQQSKSNPVLMRTPLTVLVDLPAQGVVLSVGRAVLEELWRLGPLLLALARRLEVERVAAQAVGVAAALVALEGIA